MLREELRIAVAREIGIDESIVNVIDVTKNNGVKKVGITISESNVSPIFYIEAILRSIENGWESVSEAAKHIARQYMETTFPSIPAIPDLFKNAVIQIVNADANAEMLNDVPNVRFLDLAGVVRVKVNESANMRVTYGLCNKLGIDADELLKKAMENTKNAGFQIMGIGAALGQDDENNADLFVVTNAENTYGASAILFPELLGDYAKRMRGDFFILPSSIHEILLYPVSKADATALRGMVRSINADANLISPDDVLSNNVYLYKADTKELVVA